MKNYEEFCSYVEENILSKMSGTKKRSVEVREVMKNNNTCLRGLVIIREGNNISPTLYLDDFYEEYAMKQASLEEVLCHVAEVYQEAEEQNLRCFDVSLLQNTCVIGCLVGTTGNEDFLKDLPYVAVGEELAIIFKFLIPEMEEVGATLTITEDIANQFGYTKEKLLALALENTPKLLPQMLISMKQFLIETAARIGVSIEEEELEDSTSMYILGNAKKFNGAFALFYEGVLDSLFETIGNKLILLPSSVHEWIIVSGNKEGFDYTGMVQNVNCDVLSKEEVLGYHEFVLEKGKGSIFEQLATKDTYSR